MRVTIKKELKACPANFVYGTPLTIPGDILPTLLAAPHAEFLQQLCSTQRLPVPTAHHLATPLPPPVNLLPNLRYVFIRKDQTTPPLTQPYNGP